MSHSQQKWYSSGYDLWVVPYQSEWYAQIDWWCQFFLSQNLDQEQFKKGQTYIVDVRRFLPNKKVWVYPNELNISDVVASSEKLAHKLSLSSVRVFSLQKCDTPDENNTKIKWSVVTPDQ